MSNKYYAPEYKKDEFHCPFCSVFSHQNWAQGCYSRSGFSYIEGLEFAFCSHCGNYSIWLSGKMIYPAINLAPPPHDDMPNDVRDDYLEASEILNKSPRGAAALLRLSLQRLLIHLGQTGKDINKDIQRLVENGLPIEVQQALDAVRVIGNEAVHPGQMDLKDDIDIASSLFNLINFIIDERISKPKRINSIFMKIPEEKRKWIEQRDK